MVTWDFVQAQPLMVFDSPTQFHSHGENNNILTAQSCIHMVLENYYILGYENLNSFLFSSFSSIIIVWFSLWSGLINLSFLKFEVIT